MWFGPSQKSIGYLPLQWGWRTIKKPLATASTVGVAHHQKNHWLPASKVGMAQTARMQPGAAWRKRCVVAPQPCRVAARPAAPAAQPPGVRTLQPLKGPPPVDALAGPACMKQRPGSGYLKFFVLAIKQHQKLCVCVCDGRGTHHHAPVHPMKSLIHSSFLFYSWYPACPVSPLQLPAAEHAGPQLAAYSPNLEG